MFDVSWQELLIVGAVALIVVGPKELPTLLRTVGKYVGLIKRQAAEFRAQFDEAMRESELAQLKKDVEKIKEDAESSLRSAEHSVGSEIGNVRREFDETARGVTASREADAHDANGLPFPPDGATPTPAGSTGSRPIEPDPRGAGAAAIAAAAAAAPPPATPSTKIDA